jgi:hypothetical protein
VAQTPRIPFIHGVEGDLPKPKVAGSRPVVRLKKSVERGGRQQKLPARMPAASADSRRHATNAAEGLSRHRRAFVQSVRGIRGSSVDQDRAAFLSSGTREELRRGPFPAGESSISGADSPCARTPAPAGSLAASLQAAPRADARVPRKSGLSPVRARCSCPNETGSLGSGWAPPLACWR